MFVHLPILNPFLGFFVIERDLLQILLLIIKSLALPVIQAILLPLLGCIAVLLFARALVIKQLFQGVSAFLLFLVFLVLLLELLILLHIVLHLIFDCLLIFQFDIQIVVKVVKLLVNVPPYFIIIYFLVFVRFIL